AGVALDGSALTIDSRSNGSFYRKPDVKANQIIDGEVQSDAPMVTRFLATVSTSTSRDDRSAAAETAPAADGAPAASQAPASEVKTFPMEDPKPGEEPK
ncbi:MAG: YSC84-related protein, partial [Steroidobacteraceae bacterium]